MPERIQLRRAKGWRLPRGVVKVDRTTRYGNPFKAGEPNHLGYGTVRDNEHAVWLYRHWLTTDPRLIAYASDRQHAILEHLPDLAGKDLACWCGPKAHCHADVLLELANLPGVAVADIIARATTPEAPRG